MSVCAHEYRAGGEQRPLIPGAGVLDGGEPPNVDAGNEM